MTTGLRTLAKVAMTTIALLTLAAPHAQAAPDAAS
jgi:hypothetical protein